MFFFIVIIDIAADKCSQDKYKMCLQFDYMINKVKNKKILGMIEKWLWLKTGSMWILNKTKRMNRNYSCTQQMFSTLSKNYTTVTYGVYEWINKFSNELTQIKYFIYHIPKIKTVKSEQRVIFHWRAYSITLSFTLCLYNANDITSK
jgi:hypothetical protein